VNSILNILKNFQRILGYREVSRTSAACYENVSSSGISPDEEIGLTDLAVTTVRRLSLVSLKQGEKSADNYNQGYAPIPTPMTMDIHT
jgi:hypothetical protein